MGNNEKIEKGENDETMGLLDEMLKTSEKMRGDIKTIRQDTKEIRQSMRDIRDAFRDFNKLIEGNLAEIREAQNKIPRYGISPREEI